jgi:hypothetical protein
VSGFDEEEVEVPGGFCITHEEWGSPGGEEGLPEGGCFNFTFSGDRRGEVSPEGGGFEEEGEVHVKLFAEHGALVEDEVEFARFHFRAAGGEFHMEVAMEGDYFQAPVGRGLEHDRAGAVEGEDVGWAMDAEGTVVWRDVKQGSSFFEADLAVMEEGEMGGVPQSDDFTGRTPEFHLHGRTGLCGLAFEKQGSRIFVCPGDCFALGVPFQPFRDFELVALLLGAVLLGVSQAGDQKEKGGPMKFHVSSRPRR